jgi:hypothetical protein
MESFTIPTEGTFILQVTLAKASPVSTSTNLSGSSASPYNTNIADLSGYEYEVVLSAKKQVLINSTTTEFTFSTTATSKNITLSRNVINLIVPIEILNANEFYTCKIRMKNSQLDLIVYNFQLLLDNYAPSTPAIKQASIVFDELTYTLLIQNQF